MYFLLFTFLPKFTIRHSFCENSSEQNKNSFTILSCQLRSCSRGLRKCRTSVFTQRHILCSCLIALFLKQNVWLDHFEIIKKSLNCIRNWFEWNFFVHPMCWLHIWYDQKSIASLWNKNENKFRFDVSRYLSVVFYFSGGCVWKVNARDKEKFSSWFFSALWNARLVYTRFHARTSRLNNHISSILS